MRNKRKPTSYTVEEREQIVAAEKMRIVQLIEEMKQEVLDAGKSYSDDIIVYDEILSAIKKGDGK